MAAVEEFRKLREDLVIVRQETPDGILHIVKDRESGRFFKFDEDDYGVIDCFGRAGSLEEVRECYEESHPSRSLDPDTLREYQAELMEMGLLERTRVEKNLMVMEKIRDARRKRAGGSAERNVFFVTFPAIDPDRFLNRVHPHIRFLWRPWFVGLSMAGILAMAGIFATHWDQLSRATLDFYNFRNKSGADILEFLVLMFVIVAIHEFAHALTCKNFGGEVHEIGFVLFYFTPAFYCDVNDAYLFQKKSHKLWVTFAGAYIELVICVAATAVWLVSRPDALAHDLSYKVILFTGLSSIVFNINPLVKEDGYYALMDWLEIPDLRERAFEYVGYLLQRGVLGLRVDRPAATRRQRRIFVTYGALAIAYTATLLGLVFGVARNWLNAFFPGWGPVMAMGIVVLIMRKRVKPFTDSLRRLWLARREALMKRRWVLLSGSAAALVLLTVPRFPVHVTSPVVLMPERSVFVSARADGVVSDLFVRESEQVHAGQRLAVLRNEDLDLQLQTAQGRRRLADSQAKAELAKGRAVQSLQAQREAVELAGRVATLREQVASLDLRAPQDGILLTARVEDLLGTYHTAGEPILEVGASKRMRALVRVSEWDIRWLSEGQDVVLRLDALPFRSFPGKVQSLAPATAEPRSEIGADTPLGTAPYRTFEVTVLIGNPDGQLRPGMAGVARIDARSISVADRLARYSSDLIGSVLW